MVSSLVLSVLMMASAAPSLNVKSNENYTKLSRLLVDGGTTALRSVFDRKHPPGTLKAYLTTNQQTLQARLYPPKGKRIMFKEQWETLYPPTGNPTSRNFDISILSILLREICGLTPPVTGWNAFPSAGDSSLEANLTRIKVYRNKVQHITSTDIANAKFEKYWQEISRALVALGVNQEEIDDLKSLPLGETNYSILLEEWQKSDAEIATKLNSIEEKIEEVLAKFSELTTSMDEMKKDMAKRCWESRQEGDLSGPHKGMDVPRKAESCLQNPKPDTTPEALTAMEEWHLYSDDRINWMLGEENAKKCEEKVKSDISELEFSLSIWRPLFGDHTVNAGVLNAIGNLYMIIDDPTEALKRYQEAMEMMKRLVGSDRHWGMPTYYNQMAAVYERFGALEEEKSWFGRSKKKVKEHYTKAKRWIEKAIDLEKELGVSEKEHTATFKRNLANILVALGDYDNALKNAQESRKIRQEQLGTHPETARILYLIGIINEYRNDNRAALEAYEEAFDVEESLPSDNHSVVRYLIRNTFNICVSRNGKNSTSI